MSKRETLKGRKWVVVLLLVAALIVAGIVTCIITLCDFQPTTPDTDIVPEPPAVPSHRELSRIDCIPEGGEMVSRELCDKRNCVYGPPSSPEIPACYYPQDDSSGYKVTQKTDTNFGFNLELVRVGDFPFAGGIGDVIFRVEERADNFLRFVIDDPNAERYKVPVPLTLPTEKAKNPMYQLKVTSESPFSFQVIRRSTGTVLWDTGVGGLVFSDQFIQIATKLPSKNVYGFGENLHKSFRHDMNHTAWPLFSRDQPPKWKDQSSLYGVHPFYQCVETDGNTHGVFLLNSNAQEYGFTPLPMLTYRTLGGILDFYVFMGPKPEEVVAQYTQVIGRPVMPPYWALGFQLCRYGYNSLDNLKAAVDRTRAAQIPHDVQYADIDHMDMQMDFTIDPVNFADLPNYFRELRSNGMRTIIILDPTLISNVTDYPPYERMKAVDGNIKWPAGFTPPADSSDSQGALLGYVWPVGKVVFPDFFKNFTRHVWRELIVEHHSVLPFDGMWIDMNEPANFGTNLEKPWNWPEDARPYWSLKCGSNTLDEPPYRPMAAYVHDENGDKKLLADKTICMNSVQGEGRATYSHYDVHSLYGWSQTEVTQQAVKESTGNRGMVITRSTFAGSGQFSGHWLGDNDSKWPDLHHSIIGMLEFNLFGIPYIGADICGFWGNTTAEMCKRWMQLGAFYTFSRNHNGKDSLDQDPGNLGDEVIRVSREALETRYWLLPYLYTLFHNAHAHGNTVIRPLHHEFPTDEAALATDKQFLWGHALLISPILEPNQTSVSIYLPKDRWYNFYTGAMDGDDEATILTLPVASDERIPLHIRGHAILPMQKPANNTYYSRKNPLSLLVALDRDGAAWGEMMWDDGEEIDTYETGNNFYTTFVGKRNSVEMILKWRQNVPEIDNLYFDMIKVYGVSEEVAFVYVDGQKTPHENFTYNHTNSVLIIEDLNLPLAQDFKVTWDSGRRVQPSEAMRVDCLPDIVDMDMRMESETICANRGCIWLPSTEVKEVPPCFFNSSSYGYRPTTVTSSGNRIRYQLTRMGSQTVFGGDFQNITLDITEYSNTMMRFTFDAQDPSARYKVPIDLNIPEEIADDKRYEFEVTSRSPFSFRILRKSTKTVIWDSSVGGLTFADQFLQIATRLPSRNVYGLGENRHASFRHDMFFKRWGAFSRDQPPEWGDGVNLYGVHPFYTCVEDENNAHGVFLLNSNAQDYSLSPLPMLTYRTIGGVLDFFVFMGPHPENVIQQYTQLIGRPMMPPYWSLGFQLCRYGYNSLENLQSAVQKTLDANIPLDVQYADIDHMDERKDFTINQNDFSGLNEYFTSLQQKGMRIIIILDPALISNETNYDPYDQMAAADANIKWPSLDDNGNQFTPPADSSDPRGALLGYVWPKGKTVFPDFFKSEAKEIWRNLIDFHHKNNLTFDGLWIDMNEPANFGTNLEKSFNWPDDATPYWSLKCYGNKWDDPPYRTMASYVHDSDKRNATLPDKTICMNSVQGTNGMYRHYDVHSLYGWSQTEPTYQAVQATTGERGIVISRSTFPGSGKHAGHWLGDNNSKWSHLADSIIGMLEFNLFGIPYIGADICGFFDNTTVEMCKRWMQLGAFYTFSRNHNGLGYVRQDPGSLGEDVAEASRVAMETRYWLLPYLYTLFHHAHTKGSTVIRPLHHEFIWDTETYRIDRQFLWGPALLISPILEENQKELMLYLPVKSRWYNYYTGEITSQWGGHSVTLEVKPESRIPLHLRGGYILPLQAPANNTHFSRQNGFTVLVALDRWSTDGGSAEGELFWDDGVSIDTADNYFFTKFFSLEKRVEMKIQRNSSVVNGLVVNNVEVYGVNEKVDRIYVQTRSQDLDSMMIPHDRFEHDAYRNVLKIKDLNLVLNTDFTVYWNPEMPSADEAMRIDCLPDSHLISDHQSECSKRGCVWKLPSFNGVPACFIDRDRGGYSVNQVIQEQDRMVYNLRKADPGQSMFGGDVQLVTVTVYMLSDSVIRIKLTDALDPNRYEVPVPLTLPTGPPTANRLYDMTHMTTGSANIFSFKVTRRSTGTTLFDTSIGGLTFADQFLQLVTKLPSFNVYGFGEHRHDSFRHNMFYQHWPMFARDQGVGHNSHGNLYGVHPFFTCLEDDKGNSFGVFLRNSNAQEVVLLPSPAVTYRTTGGILDFFIFLGPSPENVIQQYTQLIGRPYFPPYWSLGFQLCRYGYNHIDNLKAAYERTIEAEIPLDVQYADIDHMDERMDFTIDPVNFAGLPDFVKSIQAKGSKFIIILDPAIISNVTSYKPYLDGLARDVYIKWPPGLSPDYSTYNNDNMLGYVWPKGKTVFPDYLKPATQAYWADQIADWYRNLTFDGLWIDMNEPANFETNNERPQNWPAKDRPYWSLKCAMNKWDDPPYKPRSITGARLSDKTLCMVGLQTDGAQTYRHYDVHSLYGWSESKPTLTGLRRATGKRGIVISRSTFPGSGKDTGHWLGDNDSLWSHMKDSIVGMLEFNLFGIPYVGADICGFARDTTKEMCQRWSQLGAFYPFSRNHNAIGQKDQDPGVLGAEVADSTRRALRIRYSLLPVLYTLFYRAHTDGSTVVRSLMHQYPTDSNTWAVDTQFLWGSDFMVAPVVEEAKLSRTVYFPNDIWYDYHTGKAVPARGQYLTVLAPMDHIPLYVRGGAILPRQEPANNTHFSRLNEFNLLVALDAEGTAQGELFWDDGESIDTVENGDYFMATFSYGNTTDGKLLRSDITKSTRPIGLTISEITILGVTTKPKSVLNSVNTPVTSFTHYPASKKLVIVIQSQSLDAALRIQILTV